MPGKADVQFGGDPGHVTLGGASAGAASITLQLTAYGGVDSGLFHASAAESQSFGNMRTIPESQYQYDNLVIRTGCMQENDTLACLRGLNASFLQSQNSQTPSPGAEIDPLYMYTAVLDYDFVTDYTLPAYFKGNFIKLPAIYGDDTNEGTIFTPNSTANLSASDIFLKAQYSTITIPQLRMINNMYPIAEQFPDSGPFWRQVSNAYGEIRWVLYSCER